MLDQSVDRSRKVNAGLIATVGMSLRKDKESSQMKISRFGRLEPILEEEGADDKEDEVPGKTLGGCETIRAVL